MKKLNILEVIELSKTITPVLEKLEADIIDKLKANIGKHRFFKVREYPLLRVSTTEDSDHIILRDDCLVFNENVLKIDTALTAYIYAVKKFKRNLGFLDAEHREVIKSIELPSLTNELFGLGLSPFYKNKDLYKELKKLQEIRLKDLGARQEAVATSKSEKWLKDFNLGKFVGYDELADAEKEVLSAKNADELTRQRDDIWR